MIDPVNKSKIPEEWLEKSGLPRDELEEGIKNGMLVLLSDGSVLKRGYTTGTTAAAAAKAAVLSLGKELSDFSVPTPSGVRANFTVIEAKDGYAKVAKIQNDHESDITRGLEFVGQAKPSDTILITAGEGIGIVTRGGLQVKKGFPAINPKPLAQIRAAVEEAIEEIGLAGVEVEISLPKGAETAKKTLNSTIGVEGGISILGTTGFVEPWNDHLGEMKSELISSSPKVVLTTGRIGIRYSTMLFPDYTVVLAGSRISEGLEAVTGEAAICGLPGLILKWGDPEILKDTGFATVSEMIEVEPGGEHLKKAFRKTVEKANGARVVIVDRDGTVLMDSEDLK